MSNMTVGLHQIKRIMVVLVLGMILSACGNTTTAKPVDDTQTNEWDNMKWDQSPWG